jgi:O-succinylbenzoate synthase
MKIDLVEMRLLEMKLVRPFETSFGSQTGRRVVLVAVHSEGLQGWGECVAGDEPFYSYETPETAWYVLKDFVIPALLGGKITGKPARFFTESGFVRGHHMARAAVEAALWDLQARKQGLPLHKLFRGERTKLPTGVSIGIQPTFEELLERIGEFHSLGYRRIKIKIKPGWDVDVVRGIRERYPDLPLMVDANSAYKPADAERLAELDRFGLMMIEQPLAHDDLVEHAQLQRRLKTPICLDESIVSLAALRAALALGSCRIVNVKQGRVGGPTQAIGIHDACREAGVPVWCGGMLETGIGRTLNIALATLENFILPGDISASSRYWREDIIDPPVTVDADGTLQAPSGPGLGYEPNIGRIEKATTEKLLFRP